MSKHLPLKSLRIVCPWLACCCASASVIRIVARTVAATTAMIDSSKREIHRNRIRFPNQESACPPISSGCLFLDLQTASDSRVFPATSSGADGRARTHGKNHETGKRTKPTGTSTTLASETTVPHPDEGPHPAPYNCVQSRHDPGLPSKAVEPLPVVPEDRSPRAGQDAEHARVRRADALRTGAPQPARPVVRRFPLPRKRRRAALRS